MRRRRRREEEEAPNPLPAYLHDPVEVELLGRSAKLPPILQERRQDGRARRHADARPDHHNRLVIAVQLGGSAVRTVHAQNRSAALVEPQPQLHVSAAVAVFEVLHVVRRVLTHAGRQGIEVLLQFPRPRPCFFVLETVHLCWDATTTAAD